LSPRSSVLLLAKTITHPAARSLCDSWASCCEYWTKLFGSILHADEWINNLDWGTLHNSTSWRKILEWWKPLCALL